MVVSKIYEINSCDDMELGVKRSTKLNFKLCYDDDKPVNAIVFIVPGCGGDVDKAYRDHLAEFTAREFNVAVINVDYHHIYNRLVTGARYYMDEFDQEILREKCREINLQLGGDLSSLKNFDKLNGVLSAVSNYIDNNKNSGAFPKDFVLNLSLTIDPAKDEYQNFGIMQAQDLINALLFIKANAPFKAIKNLNELPVVMIGSSHGGYLSHMAAKIAPWLIDGVIDNSSYAKYPLRIVGFGKELDYMNHCCSSNDMLFKHINFFISDKTLWTLKDGFDKRFMPAHEKIRYILNLDHVKTQSKYPKPIYLSYHYAGDDIAPIADKSELYSEFNACGIDATLKIIKDESELDGKFIKSLTHGFDMSIKTLISKELPPMLAKIATRSKQPCEDKSITYISENLEYKFFESNDKINLQVSKIWQNGTVVKKTYKIHSCDDTELNIKRESLLEFNLCFDTKKPVSSIVFIIPGYGGDADSNYREHLAQFIASEFNAAVVGVNYHCIGDRPQTGATIFFDDLDRSILKKECARCGIELPENLSLIDTQTLLDIDNLIDARKRDKTAPQDLSLKLSISLQPTKNEYQNFGIMQAQDLINALLFVKANAPFECTTDINDLPVVMIGSSHGGYLSHMAAKIAPWLIDGVIDNSSYALAHWPFIGFGKEIDYMKYYSGYTSECYHNIELYLFDKTHWTLDKASPAYFSKSRKCIREILIPQHLKVQSGYKKQIYTSYHYAYDDFYAPASEKQRLYDELKNLGYDATLNIIENESQLDGKFIKTLTHGLDMSIKTLISKELPPMLAKIIARPKQPCKDKSISYVSDDLEYKFFEANDKINLEIKEQNLPQQNHDNK